MISAVDTSVILDVLTDDPEYGATSERLLEKAYNDGPLIISDIVYAELSPQFDSQKDLDKVLERLNMQFVECRPEVAWFAGQKWAEYRKAGGSRSRLVADFLIGAHAQLCADRLLTRDRGFYRSYFPELVLLEG